MTRSTKNPTFVLTVAVALLMSPVTSSQNEETSPSSPHSEAFVFFYHLGFDLGFQGVFMVTPRPSIFCDGRLLGKLKKGNYFLARLSPGKHTIYAVHKDSSMEFDLEPGGEYFIRVEFKLPSFGKAKGTLAVTSADRGREMVSRLAPAESKLIKDPRVTTTIPDHWGAAELKQASGQDKPLTTADVIALHQAGFGDEFILEQIRNSRTAFRMDDADLAELRKANVSQTVVDAMTKAQAEGK